MKMTPVPAVRRAVVSVERDRDRRALIRFAAVALPTGWILLSLPIVLDQPFELYVLAVLLLGLMIPAVLLTRLDPAASVRRDLLRDLLRLPRPAGLLLPALVVIPALTWCAAVATGGARSLSGSLAASAAVNVVSSLVIVNLWEEMAWTGFVQRRAIRTWGYLGGSTLTAVLFAAIHAPLAADGAHDASEVALNAGILLGSAWGLRLLIGALDLVGGHSLLAVAVLHASFNSAALFIAADSDWIRYIVTIALGAVVAAAMMFADRRRS